MGKSTGNQITAINSKSVTVMGQAVVKNFETFAEYMRLSECFLSAKELD